jgi:hypothetical protein
MRSTGSTWQVSQACVRQELGFGIAHEERMQTGSRARTGLQVLDAHATVSASPSVDKLPRAMAKAAVAPSWS